MLRILQKEGRTEAYWKTVDKYQFLPDIMKIRFDWLATKKDWSAILAMLDRSIVLAEQDHRAGDVIGLKENKLEVYQLMNDSDNIRAMAADLFYRSHEPMVQYHLLKKVVPAAEWLDFLEQLLSNSKNYPARSVNAEIFIAERNWEKLMSWVWDHTRLYPSYNTAEPYEKYLVKHHPERLLDMYRIRLMNHAYAQYRKGSLPPDSPNHATTAKTTRAVNALVKELLEFFRTHYGNRRAMMAELGRIFNATDFP